MFINYGITYRENLQPVEICFEEAKRRVLIFSRVHISYRLCYIDTIKSSFKMVLKKFLIFELIPFFVIRLPIYFDGFVRHHHRDEVGSFEIALPIFLKAIDVTFFHLQKEAWS